MKLYELNQKTKKAFTPIIVRTSLFAFFTLASIVCGILGSFYFHLLRQDNLASLICFGACALSIILGIIALILKRKDDYNSFMACMLVFGGSAGEAECKRIVDEFLNPNQGGFAGFKSAVRDNKTLLSAMLTGCKAIPKYADRGVITALMGIILRFAYKPFVYFALIDGLLCGGGRPNHIYRVMSSTRWFPMRDRYSKSPVSFAFSKLLPIVGWIILSAVGATVLNSFIGITPAMEAIIWFGFLSLVFQLRNFGGNRNVMHRMALDITSKEPVIIPEADYNLCMAFAQISQVYFRACVEAGFIQSTSEPSGTDKELIADPSQQMLE